MKETLRSIIVGAFAAVIFLLLFLGVRWNFFICVLLAAGLYGSVYLLSSPRRRIGKVVIDRMENGEELQKKLEEAREDFKSISSSMQQIEDASLKEEAQKLHDSSAHILDYLEQNPAKIPLARRFIDYYQDTASSLLQKYVKLQDTSLETEETRQLKEKTKQAIHTLNTVFDRQFQKLMGDELMNLDAEIEVMEQTIKMEDLR